jgi:hypothetical protein
MIIEDSDNLPSRPENKQDEEKNSKLSARALGLLVFIATRETNISAESLKEHFKEGRDAVSSALKELRINQLIKTSRGKAGNYFYTQTLITDQGKDYLETHLRIKVLQKILHVSVIEYVNIELQVRRGAKKLNSELNTELDPNSAEYQEKALKIFEASQVIKNEKRIKQRSLKAKEDWTPSDSGYEFEQKISNIWSIPPWSVTESRFIPALASARRKHKTDGQIESDMMDLYLIDDGWLKHQTGDRLWKGFIRRFSDLAQTAKLKRPRDYTEEELRQIRKKWDEFF